MKMKKLIILLLITMACLPIVMAEDNVDVTVFKGQYYTGSQFNTGTYDFRFDIYNVSTGGTPCFNYNETITTGDWGEWEVEFFNVTASCQDNPQNYFVNINIDNVDQTPRKRMVIFNYPWRTGNITVSERGFFDILGSILDRIAKIWVIDLDVSGDLTLNNVSINDWSDVGNTGLYYNKTSTTYTGSLSSGGYTGYKAGNYICNAEFSGTHLCYQSEVMLTIDSHNVSNLTQWSDNAWIMTGGAKYSPASLPVNDCNGFTHGTSDTYLGGFWMFSQDDGGTGGVGHCANSLPLACCKEGGFS